LLIIDSNATSMTSI